MDQKILAVIPARGGSKGVPRKNIRFVGGKPLIAYSIEAALCVRGLFHRIIVSTDDDEIMQIAKDCGADVPFKRPENLGSDKMPMLPVLKHAVEFIENQDQIKLDWVFLLQPTAPLRNAEDIEAAINLAVNGSSDSVISVVQVFAVHPILMKKIEGNRLLPFCIEEKEGTRRQDYKPDAFMRNGAIYLSKRDVIMEHSSIWGQEICPYVMPEERSLNIDSEFDLKMVELVLAEQKKHG